MTPHSAEISALIAARRLPEADQLARRACAEAPGDPDAWYLQAAVQSMQGHWPDVARCCRQVIALDPAHAEAHYNLAAALASLARYAEAATVFQRVLVLRPDLHDACLGLARCHQLQGHPEDALRVLDDGLRTQGGIAALHAARADALLELGEAGAAVDGYQDALRLDPGSATAHFGLGCALQRLGRPADARGPFESVIALEPGFTDAHGRLGAAFAEMGRWTDALRCFRQVLALEPGHLSALINCGAALRASGRLTEAAESYRTALAHHPDSDLARYFLATVGVEGAPEQPPESYIKELFDSYAPRFDQDLVGKLRYSTPALIASTLEDLSAMVREPLDVLDLGCGTGLVGAAIRGRVSRLAGIDLSPVMISSAREKGLYDELHVAEIGAFLATDTRTHGLIVAADVFVYVGDLARILAAGARRLGPGGLFIFSVEHHPGTEPYVLRPSGRYAHSPAYVRSSASAAGLTEVRASEHVPRFDANTPIAGDLFVYRG